MWNQEYRSRRLIAQLDRAAIRENRNVAIPADFFSLGSSDKGQRRKLEALEARRTRFIERQFGARFEDLQTSDQCRAYLDIDLAQPTVYDAVKAAWA
jgi:hypothetical protein